MQPKKIFKVLISVALGVLFLWLAFREVELQEVWEAARGMSNGWILPFVAATLVSHFIRAERWRMLFTGNTQKPARLTLFTGVMFGYLTNIVLPRVGEVARPVYVARQVNENNSKLIGTIVLERIIDVLSMLFIMMLVGIFLISDPEVLTRLFGIDFTDTQVQIDIALNLALYGSIAIFTAVVLYQVLKRAARSNEKVSVLFEKGRETGRTFMEGVLAIKDLRNWPLFVVYTALIWAFYIGMTYIPFYMFDLQEVFGLGMQEAVILTMVSAVGLSIPTPGGVGTYHLFITQAMFVLFAVPEATGLAYATIAHASTLIVILISTPILLAWDKWYVMKTMVSGETMATQPDSK